MTTLYEIFKMKQLCLSSVSKSFQKMQETTDISDETNILRSPTYIFVLCKIFYKIREYHWIINVKILFICGIWKTIQFNIDGTSQIVEKLLGELKSQKELIF